MSSVLLFHGMTGTPAELEPLSEKLRKRGFRVVTPELPGHLGGIEELKQTHASTFLSFVEEAFEREASRAREPIIVGGLSFGALLALYLCAFYPSQISSAVLMSLPLRFRSKLREAVLNMLSAAPEALLDKLPCVEKTRRPAGYLAIPHVCFSKHSIGAAARLVKIRKITEKYLHRVRARVLVLQDPGDHHVSPRGVRFLQSRLAQTELRVKWIKNGQHELTLGHSSKEVCDAVVAFLNRGELSA
jgi:carboxylesterase